jgi:hypothetical protein
MAAKTLWVAALAVTLLAVGGLGFAAFTATYFVNLSGTGGELSLGLSNWNVQTSASYVGCTVSGYGSNWVNFSAGPFAPGDWCAVFGNVTNTGNVGANVTVHNWFVTANPGCFLWKLETPQAGSTQWVLPGGSVAFEVVLELNSQATNVCQGATGTVTVQFVAVAHQANELLGDALAGQPGAAH